VNDTSEKAFLGIGWSFPPSFDAQGEVNMAAYEEDVRQAIRIILSTNHTERVMRPDFGANMRALLFEPMSTTTMSLAQHYVERALIEWEPRIDLDEVTVRFDKDDPSRGKLLIDINYRVRATNTFYNLVYPFYLLEGSE
jgi:phage baseplate assembly protein W